MSTVDKIMALADAKRDAWEQLRDIERYIGGYEDGPEEQATLKERKAKYDASDKALRAAVVEALDLGEPVAALVPPCGQLILRDAQVSYWAARFPNLAAERIDLYATKDKP